MEIAFTECIAVTDSTSVGEARRAAILAGQRLDFDETRTGELALPATEVSRNVLIHGRGGQVILAGFKDDGNHFARIVAMDSGPGIANVARALSDGFSTAGTMGGGLGAMKRLASGLEIFTGPGGTIVLVEVGQSKTEHELEIAGMAVPYPGERSCGDGWMLHRTSHNTVAILVDGIGHGIGAADAAQEAIATFKKYADTGPDQILRHVHDALRKTRGAVAAVAEIRPSEKLLIYAGVGNISAVQLDLNRTRSLVSHNGTLGAMAPRFQEFRSDWSSQSVLVMHSDGLQTRWDFTAYSGLISKHPAVIGATLLRDFRRTRDDASVIVIKAK
jgi:anti-sigma regulatory factor (Ser/Thr protein kinase)